MLDLLIRGGLIIDGTGNPRFHAAIAVENERVRVLRGETDGIEARRTIDATGRVVCPGFRGGRSRVTRVRPQSAAQNPSLHG
jgi:N-acyl-D-amino-acid deacylase